MQKPLRFILFVLLLFPVVGAASDSAKLTIGTSSFENIQADKLNINMTLTNKGIGFTASANSIQFTAPIGRVTGVKLQCDELLTVSEQFSCAQGRLSFHHKTLGQQSVNFEVTAAPETEHYKLEVSGFKLASAVFSFTAIFDQQHWKIFADTPQVEIVPLIDFLSPYLSAQQQTLLTDWNYSGKLKLDIDLKGYGSNVSSFNLDVDAKGVDLSDSQGKYVTEALTSVIHVSAINKQQIWTWKTKINFDTGQAYGEPVFIDLNITPVKLQAEGTWQNDTQQFQITAADLIQNSVMQLAMTGQGSMSQLDRISISMSQSDVAKLYEIWMQPFTVGTSVDNLELAGTVAFSYQQQADDYHLSLTLDEVFIDDQANRFSFDAISGTFGWSNYAEPEQIAIEWKSGSIYALSLGASTLKAQVKNASLELQQPWLIPILDGELRVNDFKLQQLENELPIWDFAGELTPVSMAELSAALQWPLMHGKLSGVIPKVSYADQQIKVEGALRVNLFDGETIIRDLQLDQPFGVLPQLRADITMKNINLETLTQTFDFGKITGNLDGSIHKLRLSNWQPVQFDASFSTPDGDKSRHRISQKAVDNLSQIGGGASGVLQRSFLRFFEDFSYQRLGLSCQLNNEVCIMSGVGEAEQGYYIVKGGGLPPRINVVGYTRRVNWPDLIERLKAVINSDGPIIK